MGGKDGEQAEDQGQRPCSFGDGEPRHAVAVRASQRAAPARAPLRLRTRAVRRVLRPVGRQGDSIVRHPGGGGERQDDHDARGSARRVVEEPRDRGHSRRAASVAAGVDRRAGAALRLLPERDDDPGGRPAGDDEEADGGADPTGDERPPVPLRDLSADPDRDPEGGRGDGEGGQVAMSEVLKKEFSRKAFVKGGGALVVAFSLSGSAVSGKADAADGPYASNGVDQYSIDSWITINADNTATIRTGGIKQGTGSDTGLLMIAGEELNMEMSQLQFVLADTSVTPDPGIHSASNTITHAGPGVRAAAATAAQALLGLAATQLGVPVGQLSVSK